MWLGFAVLYICDKMRSENQIVKKLMMNLILLLTLEYGFVACAAYNGPTLMVACDHVVQAIRRSMKGSWKEVPRCFQEMVEEAGLTDIKEINSETLEYIYNASLYYLRRHKDKEDDIMVCLEDTGNRIEKRIIKVLSELDTDYCTKSAKKVFREFCEEKIGFPWI